ncbi:MAG: SH3 domain-containing protein [Lachnospiraceae bacterium]|nr:SH3 domain-containing protein [Lachnospiraceae bacterium]
MSEMNRINDEALEEVAGGKLRRVANDSANYVNVRSGPGTGFSKEYTLRNGCYVDTVRKVFNEDDGYYWTQIDDGCWIASHLLK